MKALPNFSNEGNFIALNGHVIASINLLLRKHQGQISFANYRTESVRLNLRMCESSLDNIIAELVDSLCQRLDSRSVICSLSNAIGPCSNPWTRHRMKQFLHDVLYSEVLSEDVAWNGDHDFKRVYCYKSSVDQLLYYSAYERGDLIELVMSHSMIAFEIEDQNLDDELLSGKLNFYIGKC